MAEETTQERQVVVTNQETKVLSGYYKVLTGRKVIYSSVPRVTRDNVLDVFDQAYIDHQENKEDIDYLWKYYKGNQPVLYRIKDIRPEINNKIVENRANEIVSFKVGYLCGEPIQYVSHTSDERITKEIEKLNNMMYSEGKAKKDKEIVEWQMICGTAYRYCVPDRGTMENAPFNIYSLDPRYTFVVYSTDIEHEPLMSVAYSVGTDGLLLKATCYTDDACYVIQDGKVYEEPFALKMNPIIEYPANSGRLGAFEIVIPLLDALNELESNRMDGVQQFVQSFLKFINCDIDEEGLQALKDLGAIKIKSVDGLNADVDLISQELNQSETQVTATNLYDSILTICGMPNRNGGSSTSDTGAAVQLRDGWSAAEARAKDSEIMFSASEREFLKIALNIARRMSTEGLDLQVKDIDIQFTRRNYDNIQSKAQVLVSMLQNDKIHPLLAFTHCGMFSDPESAYQMSMKYYEDTLNAYETDMNDMDIQEAMRNENAA